MVWGNGSSFTHTHTHTPLHKYSCPYIIYWKDCFSAVPSLSEIMYPYMYGAVSGLPVLISWSIWYILPCHTFLISLVSCRISPLTLLFFMVIFALYFYIYILKSAYQVSNSKNTISITEMVGIFSGRNLRSSCNLQIWHIPVFI